MRYKEILAIVRQAIFRRLRFHMIGSMDRGAQVLQCCFAIRECNQNCHDPLLLENLSACHKSQLVESARPSISSICEGEQHETSNCIEASSEPEDSEPVPSGGHSTQNNHLNSFRNSSWRLLYRPCDTNAHPSRVDWHAGAWSPTVDNVKLRYWTMSCCATIKW